VRWQPPHAHGRVVAILGLFIAKCEHRPELMDQATQQIGE
jgi:hypothetical protein